MSFKKFLFKKIYKLHVFVGIFVAIHFAVFALSGLGLLFKDEVQGASAETPATEQLEPALVAQNYGRILETIRREFPNDRPLALFPEDGDPTRIHARIGIDGATKLRGARREVYDLRTGALAPAKPERAQGFFDVLLELHRELFLGSNGKLYVGFVGLLYVFMLVSGFFIYGNFMKGRSFGDLRPSRILKTADLHKFAGVVTFGWGLIVGLSGVFLAFNGVLIRLFQASSLKHLSAQYAGFSSASGAAQASFETTIASALAARPESALSYVSFPDTEFGIPGHFLMLMNGTTPLTERLAELVVVNSRTGALSEIVELPLYLKFVMLSEPLHFGDYGGIFLKVLWALFTVGSLAVAGLGVASYAMKKRRQKAAAEGAASVPAPAVSGRLATAPTSRFPYAVPTLLATVTALGAVIALFATGVWARLAVTLMVLPFVISALRRNRRA